MNFQFKVNVSDKDYLDYNKFWMLRSPYGKKQIKSFRIIMAAIIAVGILFLLLDDGFSPDFLIESIPLLILLFIFELCITPFMSFTLKRQIKSLKKSGKMGYSPSSVLEFYDDYFIETTESNKTEQKYSAVERISIVDGKMIYIHVNNIMAHMLPICSFESKEQYEDFLIFLKTKCINIDIY